MILVHKILAETAGTFAMVFAGYGTLLLSEKYPHAVPAFCVPLVFGLVITGMIFAFGHVSGAHFNPAVTLAFAAAKRLPLNQIFIYWGSQFLGGLAAIGLLSVLQNK